MIKFNWATGVATAYTLFALATLGFVAFAMSEPVSLVSARYYEDALRQDERTAATARGTALGDAVRIAVPDAHGVLVVLPPDQRGDVTGEVTFYRPSDAAADRVYPLVLRDDATMRVDTDALARGYWVVKLRWTTGGADYYKEAMVRLR